MTFLVIFSLASKAQLFYEITGNGLKEPSYLFGTHHLASDAIIKEYNLDLFVDEVNQIVGEIDLTQDQMALAMAMQPYMMAPADSTISTLLSPEDFAAVDEVFKKYAPMPGMTLKMVDMMKPMVVTTMITVGVMSEQMSDFNPEVQLDSYLMKRGKEGGKKITPLETADFQASVLYNTTPIAIQAEDLVEVAKNPEKLISSSQKLNEAYANGDLETMMQLSEQEDSSPEFMQALLDRRNADWLTKLPTILQDGPTFIAVGALHLAGDKGIVEGLRKLGYKVEGVVAAEIVPEP